MGGRGTEHTMNLNTEVRVIYHFNVNGDHCFSSNKYLKTFDSNKAKRAGHIWVSQSYYAVTEREAMLDSDMLSQKSGVFQGDPGKDCFQPRS